MPPSIHKLPTYLNTNKKWTFAVYYCVCSHKFMDLIKYVRNSGLPYWDQVMVVNSLAGDIFVCTLKAICITCQDILEGKTS